MNIQQRNNIHFVGEGQELIMFAHGFGSNQQAWQYILPSFITNYRALLFDYVGSGQSHKESYTTERYATIHGYVQDIIDIVVDEKVITPEMDAPLKAVVGLRKMLVREFIQVNDEEVLNVLTDNLAAIKQFPGCVQDYLTNELGPVSAFLPEGK